MGATILRPWAPQPSTCATRPRLTCPLCSPWSTRPSRNTAAGWIRHRAPNAETLDTLRGALDTGRALLAYVDGQPVGCVFYHRERDHVYLGRLSVLEPFRGKGVGGALTDGVERRARAVGAPWVEIGVRTALPALRAYYERRGYRVVRHEAHPGYAAPTFVVMHKELR
jgi:GNAT superfamily N-acetyltransferase